MFQNICAWCTRNVIIIIVATAIMNVAAVVITVCWVLKVTKKQRSWDPPAVHYETPSVREPIYNDRWICKI